MFTGSKTDLLKVGSLFIYSTGYKTREKKLFLNLIVHVHWSRGGHYLYTYKRNCKVSGLFLILLICTMVNLV